MPSCVALISPEQQQQQQQQHYGVRDRALTWVEAYLTGRRQKVWWCTMFFYNILVCTMSEIQSHTHTCVSGIMADHALVRSPHQPYAYMHSIVVCMVRYRTGISIMTRPAETLFFTLKSSNAMSCTMTLCASKVVPWHGLAPREECWRNMGDFWRGVMAHRWPLKLVSIFSEHETKKSKVVFPSTFFFGKKHFYWTDFLET